MGIVLIVGASRGVGLATVKAALSAGHQVRALARSAHEIEIEDPALLKISGSGIDPDVVGAGVVGVSAVITCVGTLPTLDPVSLFSDTARVVTTAMQIHGVARLIAVTGIGVGDSKGAAGALFTHLIAPFLLGKVHEDREREEEIIRLSPLDWTIVRPGFLTRFPATGRYRVLTDPTQWKPGFIPRADLADFLVKQIDDRSFVRETPLVID